MTNLSAGCTCVPNLISSQEQGLLQLAISEFLTSLKPRRGRKKLIRAQRHFRIIITHFPKVFHIHHAEYDYIPALLGVIENQGISTPPLSSDRAAVCRREKGKGKGMRRK